MIKHVDRPFWANWLSWHLWYRYSRRKAPKRQAAWTFVNLVRTLPAGAVVIDGGANVGKITALFVDHGLEVHAFEPDPAAADIFAERFRDNALVHLHRAALGVAPGRMMLYRTRRFSSAPVEATVSSSLFPRETHENANKVEVDVIDLVAFIKGLEKPVALLKLDVEGAETAILDRIIDDGLHREIGFIFAETHERHSAELARQTGNLRRRIAEANIKNINLDWR